MWVICFSSSYLLFSELSTTDEDREMWWKAPEEDLVFRVHLFVCVWEEKQFKPWQTETEEEGGGRFVFYSLHHFKVIQQLVRPQLKWMETVYSCVSIGRELTGTWVAHCRFTLYGQKYADRAVWVCFSCFDPMKGKTKHTVIFYTTYVTLHSHLPINNSVIQVY